jgi:FKBP-type peptidyl-prolyl cis-trans isomerase
MNPKHLRNGLVLALATAASALAQGGAPAAAAPAAAAPAAPAGQAAAAVPAPAYANDQLLEEFGWFVAQKTGLSQLELTPAEADSLTKGITEALVGKPSPYEIQKIGPAMSEYVEKKQTAILDRLRAKNTADSVAFFEKLRVSNKNVVETRDGLRYEILSPGSADRAKPADTVKVNYTGTLIDGTVFDSSERAGKPVEFALKQMIPGWIEGLQLIGKGGKMKLYIPPQLAYGDRGNMGIPPSSTLIFEVELVDITPAPAAAAPAAATVPTPAK